MDTKSFIRDTRPDQGFHIIGQLGLRALNLGTTHKTVIDERAPGVVDALALELDGLGVAIPGVLQTRHESVVATAEQNARIRQGYLLVRAVRRMVTKAKAPAEVRMAYGVGQKVQPTMYSSVTAALQGIVGRANAEPAEAAALGLGPATIADITAFLASLSDIGKAQEQKRAAAPLSTKERNMAGHRILQAVALIAGAGMIAFLNNPTTYASFDALLASSKKSSAKKGAPAKPPITAPASPAPAPEVGSTPTPSPTAGAVTAPVASPVIGVGTAPAPSPAAPAADTASAPPASPVPESVSAPVTSPVSQGPVASP
jgi:hypothetical protein